MASPAWTYSDWIKSSLYPVGSTARLQRLEQHIQEVSDFISTGNYNVGGRSMDKSALQDYLKSLHEIHEKVAAQSSASAESEAPFVRAQIVRPGDGQT